MKIIHTGDLHIGSAFHNLPAEKARLRRTEILAAFSRLCAYAKDSGVTAVLLAGDLFDENKTARHIKKQVFAAIAAANPVCFFYVSGNHDDEFDGGDELPKNLYLFGQRHGWESYALGENVVVTGMDSKTMTAQSLSGLRLSPEHFNIVVLHGDINGELNGKDSISLPLLQNKFIDYLALGHIHKPMLDCQRLDVRGKYRYCGCFEGRGFDEMGERGFFLLDIQNKTVVGEKFLSLSARKVVQVDVDISACKTYYEMENAVFATLRSVEQKDVCKIVLRGRVVPGLKKDFTLLSSRLEGRCFYIKIEDESRIIFSANDYLSDVTERGEFVREVGRYSMNDNQREEILEVGLKALAGEEIDL